MKMAMKISAFDTIMSKLKLQTIKFDSMMFAYLKRKDLLKIDSFWRNDTVIPRKIIYMHPQFMWENNLVKEITTELGKHPPPMKCNCQTLDEGK